MAQNNKSGKKATGYSNHTAIPTASGHFLPDPGLTRLLSIFGGNYYNWVHAENIYRTSEDAKPDYTTESGYPIEPRILTALYADPAVLVGLRFGKMTRWAGFDIDAGSRLNPSAPHPKLTSEEASTNLAKLKETAERHGLISPLLYRSSHREGIWLMWAFPETLRTIEVAALLKTIAAEAGFTPASGQLELFPNLKPYQNTTNRKKFTLFKAFRLPLQPETGAMLLDDDLEPVTDDLDALLDHLEFTASRMDIEEVRRACGLAYADHLYRLEMRWKSKSGKREAWIAELERMICRGFTGKGETNDLMGKIATLGIVRDGLSGDDLAAFIEQTAVLLPGYKEFSRHQHEIERRAREWARSAENFYWHIEDPDKSRHGSYQDMFARAGRGTHKDKAAAYHKRRAETVLEKLKAALEALEGRTLPTLNDLFKAVCEKAVELFGKGFSKGSWVKYREQLASLIAGLIQPSQPQEEAPPAPQSIPPQPLKDVAPPASLLVSDPEISPQHLEDSDAPEMPQTQAYSQGTPCLQEIAEIAPAKTPETQAYSQGTPCCPIMKVFDVPRPEVFKREILHQDSQGFVPSEKSSKDATSKTLKSYQPKPVRLTSLNDP